jgi:hypothetical protein
VTRFTLLGVGAMNSPRYSPAGLLVEHGAVRVAIDGGPGAEPAGPLAAWLVTDERAELIRELRRLTAARDLSPAVRAYPASGLAITPQPVAHTSHPAFGYMIEASGTRIAWAPEFLEFPAWAAGTDLMFAEAASWARPIRFAKGAGGHAFVLEVAGQAARHGVRQLVFAHIGRPTIAAPDKDMFRRSEKSERKGPSTQSATKDDPPPGMMRLPCARPVGYRCRWARSWVLSSMAVAAACSNRPARSENARAEAISAPIRATSWSAGLRRA